MPANPDHLLRPAPRLTLAVALALLAVTAAVYAPVTGHAFVLYDDDVYVFDNPQVLAGLTPEHIAWAFDLHGYASNWHPLTWLSLMLDCQLFNSLSPTFAVSLPGLVHTTNLLLHLANVVLLFLLLHHLTGSLWRSAFVAALFALHPLHVESVAWASERKDVLSALFFLLTLWAYAAWTERRSAARYALTLALFALGLLAKPMLVTVPFVLLLLDVWPLCRLSWHGHLARASQGHPGPAPAVPAHGQDARGTHGQDAHATAPLARLLLEKLPFFALAAASCVVTYFIQHAAMATGAAVPFGQRAANAATAYATYLARTFWPENLLVIYPVPQHFDWPLIILSAAILLALTALVLWQRRRPYLAVGWFWFLGTLVPVLGLVQVGMQGTADRYTYLPLVGLFIVLTWGAADFLTLCYSSFAGCHTLARRAVSPGKVCAVTPGATAAPSAAVLPALAAALVLIPCALLAAQQVATWRDSHALWQHAVDVAPDNFAAHANLARVYQADGDLARAETFYRRALDLKSNDPIANNGLGALLALRSQNDLALPYYLRALDAWPDFPEAHYNVGLVFAARQQYATAADEFRRTLALKPTFAPARTQLAEALTHLAPLP